MRIITGNSMITNIIYNTLSKGKKVVIIYLKSNIKGHVRYNEKNMRKFEIVMMQVKCARSF